MRRIDDTRSTLGSERGADILGALSHSQSGHGQAENNSDEDVKNAHFLCCVFFRGWGYFSKGKKVKKKKKRERATKNLLF